VVKKAWIPSRGTYCVDTSNDPFNPTIGDVTLTPIPPLQFDNEKEGATTENLESGFRKSLVCGLSGCRLYG
jgi:hypothetical protein